MHRVEKVPHKGWGHKNGENQMTGTKVLIVDSDTQFWDANQMEIAVDPRIETVSKVESAQLALSNQSAIQSFGVVILNMCVPGPATTELVRQLTGVTFGAKVVALFDVLDDGKVGYALGAGAHACISKQSPARQIVGTIIEVMAGGLPIRRDIAERANVLETLIQEFQRQANGALNPATAECPLTDRELGILNHVADGNANKQIAEILFISERTVKNHMTNILAKMNARDRAHAVRLGIENNWVTLDKPELELGLVA